MGEDFFGEVAQDIAVCSAERGNKIGRIAPPAHGQSGKLQPGDPAFGAVVQRLHIPAGEGKTHYILQEGARLNGGESQLFGADFGELIIGP